MEEFKMADWNNGNDWVAKAEEDVKAQEVAEMGEAIGWDDEITQESEFVLLEPGVYEFTVTNFDREYFDGSEKMSPCPKAEIELEVTDSQGRSAKIFENLFLNKKAEWKLSEFFIAIGQKKKGEPLKMDWRKVLGAKGKCQIVNTEYDGNKYNRVKKYIAAER